MTEKDQKQLEIFTARKRLWWIRFLTWHGLLKNTADDLRAAKKRSDEYQEAYRMEQGRNALLEKLGQESRSQSREIIEKLQSEQAECLKLRAEHAALRADMALTDEMIRDLKCRLDSERLESERAKAELAKTQAQLERAELHIQTQKSKMDEQQKLMTATFQWIRETHRLDVPMLTPIRKMLATAKKTAGLVFLLAVPILLSAQFPPPFFRGPYTTNTAAWANTNLISLSTTNATSKPLTNHYQDGVLTLFGLEAGANITLSQNPSNIVIAGSGGGGLTTNANQFLGVPLSIKSDARLTNANFFGTQVVDGAARWNGDFTPSLANTFSWGTSALPWFGATVQDGGLVFMDQFTINSISIVAGAVTASYTLFWPSAQGANGTTMINNGAGFLNWLPVLTNLFTPSLSNATIKPIVFGGLGTAAGMTNKTGQIYGLEAGANITLTPNPTNIVIASTGGGAGTLLTSNVVFVTMGGNDATGTRNRQDLPFRTMQGARAAMFSNDTMRVETGWYTNTAEITVNSNITIELVGAGQLYMSVVDSNMFHWSNEGGILYAPDWDFYGATSGPSGVGYVFWDQTAAGGIFNATFHNIYTVTNQYAIYYNGSSDRTYVNGHYVECAEGSPLGGGNNQTNHVEIYRLFTGGSEADAVSTDGIILNGSGTWNIFCDSVSSTNDDAINLGGNGKYNLYCQDIYTLSSAIISSGAGTVIHVYGSTIRSPGTHFLAANAGTIFAHDCFLSGSGNWINGLVFSGNGGTNYLIGCRLQSTSQKDFEIGNANGRIFLIATPFSASEVSADGIGTVAAMAKISRLDNDFPQSALSSSFRLYQSNQTAYTEFTLPTIWNPTNSIQLTLTNVQAGEVLKVQSATVASGVATILVTNGVDNSGGGGLTTNANQFLGVPLSIINGAFQTNFNSWNNGTNQGQFWVSDSLAPLTDDAVFLGENANAWTLLYVKGNGVRFKETSGGVNYAAIRAAPSMGANYDMLLPDAQGASGQVFTNDGTGTLGWWTPGGPVGFNPNQFASNGVIVSVKDGVRLTNVIAFPTGSGTAPALTVTNIPGVGTNTFQILNTNGQTVIYALTNNGVTLVTSNALHLGKTTNALETEVEGTLYASSNLLVKVGQSVSNAWVGGTMVYSLDNYTNLNGNVATFTNLANAVVPGNALTNKGDMIRAFWGGVSATAMQNTQNFQIVYGGTTILDTGLQIGSNYLYRASVEITRSGNSAQHVDAKLEWLPNALGLTGLPWISTNEMFEIAENNGINNTLALKVSARRVGALTNTQFRVYYDPAVR